MGDQVVTSKRGIFAAKTILATGGEMLSGLRLAPTIDRIHNLLTSPGRSVAVPLCQGTQALASFRFRARCQPFGIRVEFFEISLIRAEQLFESRH